MIEGFDQENALLLTGFGKRAELRDLGGDRFVVVGYHTTMVFTIDVVDTLAATDDVFGDGAQR